MLRHLPNAVTITRGLCGPLIGGAVLGGASGPVAFFGFIVAIATDLVDGALARRLGVASETGLLLDAVADKVLTGCLWASLWSAGWCPWWLAAPMLARVALIAVGWLFWRRLGRVWSPNLTGRLMVTYEGIALAVLLFHEPWLGVSWPSVGVAIGGISLAFALISALGYVRALVRPSPSERAG